MKETLFQAKRIDNEDMVEGFLLKGNRTYIVTADAIYYMVVSIGGAASVELVEVDPQTVCEFSGLIDKNKKKIFEHDVVEAHFRNNHSKQRFRVVFDDGMFLFDNGCVKVPRYDIYALRKIGSSVANPELLQEQSVSEEDIP